MGKRGPKGAFKVKTEWSPSFAYAIGLIASDGCLSKDGRHISFVSKDIEQICNYMRALNIKNRIGFHFSGKRDLAYKVQFSDVNFYSFLNSIGLTAAKSLTIGKLKIPEDLFFHFLRGCFDGDGYSYSYYDPRWKNSFLFYVCFCSASKEFTFWLRDVVSKRLNIYGHLSIESKGYYQLKYAKREAVVLIEMLYKGGLSMCLKRKYLKISHALAIVNDVKKST
jgi:hypothetical protein